MRRRIPRPLGLFGTFCAAALLAGCGGRESPKASVAGAGPGAAIEGRTTALCGACHAFPPPDSFPKDRWAFEVHRGFDFHEQSGLKLDAPPIEGVTAWYRERAPTKLPVLPRTPDDPEFAGRFERGEVAGPSPGEPTAISFVGLAPISDPKRPDLLACDMGRGELLIKKPDGPMALAADGLGNPAHASVADLDGDGIKDVLVADLGVPMPSDARRGRVLWLRGKKDGTFETIPLASGLGRVCDVEAADFDADGDLDLIVAVFGWHDAGEILYMERRGGDGPALEFARKKVDKRHGTIHVPVVDLDGDGKPDFVALISQEHEAVVAFRNRGGGRFEPRTLYKAPQPAFGSSGLEVVDIDGDGDLDALLTNGDVYDSAMLKPYHGVSWLENRGGDGPFAYHDVGRVYGAHRAMAGDVDGDGDLDIVASSFLGEPFFGAIRKELGADAVAVFEQAKPGEFRRHTLERDSCDYPSIALGDLDGDGKVEILAGRFRDFRFGGAGAASTVEPGPNAPVVVWKRR